VSFDLSVFPSVCSVFLSPPRLDLVFAPRTQNVTTKHQNSSHLLLLLPAFRSFPLLFRPLSLSISLSLSLSLFPFPKPAPSNSVPPSLYSTTPSISHYFRFLSSLCPPKKTTIKQQEGRSPLFPRLWDQEIRIVKGKRDSRLVPKVDATVPAACDDSGGLVGMPQTTDRDGLVARDFPFDL